MIETESVIIVIPDASIPTRLRIQITEEDVEKGNPGDSEFCPIALATKRALKEWGGYVSVGTGFVHFWVAKTKHAWTLTSDLRHSQYEFDGGRGFDGIGIHELDLHNVETYHD